MSDFTVDRAQLDAGAEKFAQLTTTVQSIHTTLQGMNLERSDFGYVPWIGSRTHDAYVDHREACLKSTDEMKNSAKTAGDALKASSNAYLTADQGGEDAAELIIGLIQAGPKPA